MAWLATLFTPPPPRTAFVEQQMLHDVEPCVTSLTLARNRKAEVSAETCRLQH